MDPVASQLTEAVHLIAFVLTRKKVKYALIGGLAVGYQAQPRGTGDVDLLLVVPQLTLPGVLEELKEKGFELELYDIIPEWTRHHFVQFSYKGFRIDWMEPRLPLHQHVIDTAAEVIWNGQPVRIASAEGLILLKMVANRGVDRFDIESLVAAKGPSLNIEWIKKEWLAFFELEDPPMQFLLETFAKVCQSGTTHP
jgi:hypothetical protein